MLLRIPGSRAGATPTRLASPFSFELLQLPVVVQPFPNCGHRNDQQNDDGDADSEGEAVGKEDHSCNLVTFTEKRIRSALVLIVRFTAYRQRRPSRGRQKRIGAADPCPLAASRRPGRSTELEACFVLKDSAALYLLPHQLNM